MENSSKLGDDIAANIGRHGLFRVLAGSVDEEQRREHEEDEKAAAVDERRDQHR
ncbi:MAG: hypothetical protein IT521_01470 [Burkholderiales bacterium]|nr:hypothetical protein [Burkholderiales bacterium]